MRTHIFAYIKGSIQTFRLGSRRHRQGCELEIDNGRHHLTIVYEHENPSRYDPPATARRCKVLAGKSNFYTMKRTGSPMADGRATQSCNAKGALLSHARSYKTHHMVSDRNLLGLTCCNSYKRSSTKRKGTGNITNNAPYNVIAERLKKDPKA